MATKKSNPRYIIKAYVELEEMIMLFYSLLGWIQPLNPDSKTCSEVVYRMVQGLEAVYGRMIEGIFGLEMIEPGA